ncbi:MAG: hypothetical protein EXR55_04990 [Dehalococcoidia bacterium]|nr:hypothetical protein [Dehalococcoidia bacterium]
MLFNRAGRSMEEMSWGQGAGESPVGLALCICPHLKEFLAIDQRKELAGRPLVRLLSADAVFDEEFSRQVEEQFSCALRERTRPFITLMALPQVVEVLVRSSSLAAILRALDQGNPATTTPKVAVLLFNGETLSLNEEELAQTLREVLGADADPEIVITAQRRLTQLLAQEQQHERQVQQDWLRRVIGGSAGDFFTLWKQPD